LSALQTDRPGEGERQADCGDVAVDQTTSSPRRTRNVTKLAPARERDTEPLRLVVGQTVADKRTTTHRHCAVVTWPHCARWRPPL